MVIDGIKWGESASMPSGYNANMGTRNETPTPGPQIVRSPAVADMFYPGDPATLRRMIGGYLERASRADLKPKALIAPHAGYVYSGPIAASAYALLEPLRDLIERVVLLGPSHYVPFTGLAATRADAYLTPLGGIPLDRAACEAITEMPQVRSLDEAHGPEHSLEVHLPFLQIVLGEFELVPLVVGEATPTGVAQVLDRLWGGEETLIVISSDLSHYRAYPDAQELDSSTSDAIRQLDTRAIGPEQACGCRGINGLLHLAGQKGLTVTVLDQRNSGDTAGDRERVVGYGAYALA